MTKTFHTRQICGHSVWSSTSYSMEALRLKEIRHWRHSRTSESTLRSPMSSLILTHMLKTWLNVCWRKSQLSVSGQLTSKNSRVIPSSGTSTGRHSEKPSHRTTHQARGTRDSSLHQLTPSGPKHQPASSKMVVPTHLWRAQAWVQTRAHWNKARKGLPVSEDSERMKK